MSPSTARVSAENAESSKYLIYRIGGDLYGTPLLDVREVVEYQKPKPMPNMRPEFIGVINLRGSVVGVVDLRKQFGCAPELPRKAALIVCSIDEGTSSVLVDQVESVSEIAADQIEKDPPVKPRVPLQYLLGVGKLSKDLITLVDLRSILASEAGVRHG